MRIYYLRLIPVFLGIFVLYWFIPQTYLRATRSEYQQVKAFYSPVKNEFIIWNQGPTGFKMFTEQGKELSQKQGRLLLPFLFSRDVAKWQGFPLTINGKKYFYDDAKNLQTSKMYPRLALGGISPLYILLESMPETSGFELPSDVMILKKDSVAFVNADTGIIDTNKSTAFTSAIKNAGAVFPFKAAANNPDPFKAFDEGLFFVDATNTLFQLKMVQGKALVKNTQYKLDKPVIALTMREELAREYYGLIVTNDTLYINRYNNSPIAIPFSYDATKHSFDMISSIVDNSINIRSLDSNIPQGTISMALDKNFAPLRNLENPVSKEQIERHELVQKGLSFLTPISFTQFTPKANGIVFEWKFNAYFVFSLLGALCGMLIYSCIQYFWHKQRTAFIKHNALAYCIIAVFGLPAAVVLAIFAPICSIKNNNS